VGRYASRLEGPFLRIERGSKGACGERFWRTNPHDNVTSIYSKDANSRIYDPASTESASRIFSWLIAEMYDTRGNAVIYKYKAENSVGVRESDVQEANRTDLSRSANRYLALNKCGNKTLNRGPDYWDAFSTFDLPEDQWMFPIAFDCGEFDPAFPRLTDNARWLTRKDAFSSYRSGFEIRTYRLCRRISMFHRLASELGRYDYLVSSTNFAYCDKEMLTYLISATQVGYILSDAGDGSLNRSLPPLEITYSQFRTNEELSRVQVRNVDESSLVNLTSGVNGSNSVWADLDGEEWPG
jgi:Salmonella virulence plasmid 65kDa B protein